MAECLKLRLLLKIADCWSVDEAAWVMDAFLGPVAEKETFYWNGFITDVETLRAANHGMACSVSLKFNGGPAGKIKRYQGSFAMFVVDRVLASGKDWDWLLHFNQDTTTHIAEQKLMPDKFRWENVHDWVDQPNDYANDGEASEVIEIQGELFPLDREGRQVPQTCLGPKKTDDGIVRRWTSSGPVIGGGGNDGKLD